MNSNEPPFLNYKSPAVQPGIGVPRTILDAPPKKEDVKKSVEGSVYTDSAGREYLLDALGQKEWSETPVFDGQYADPRLCKRDAPIAETFDLADDKQLKKYNALLKKLDPNGPSIEMIVEDRKFYRGKFVVFVTYSKIWYLLPIKK